MRKVFLKISILAIALNCSAIFGQTKPIYKLPENLPEKNSREEPFLVGTDTGLFRILSNGQAEPLWTEGKVERILRTEKKWYFVTAKGIISSSTLESFESCNNGIPFLTIKTYDGVSKKLVKKAPLIKDIAFDPFDENTMVTATAENVYLTRDGGETWKNIGSVSKRTAGIKAVAVSQLPVYDNTGAITGRETVVFESHAVNGLGYYRPDSQKPVWVEFSAGFSAMPSLTTPDEVADIIPVVIKNPDGKLYAEMYFSQTFIPNIYRYDWKTKRAVKVYKGSEPCDTIDSMCQINNKVAFVGVNSVNTLSLETGTVEQLIPEGKDKWTDLLYSPHSIVNSAYVPAKKTGLERSLTLSELWLLKPEVILTPWGEPADDRKAVYVSAYQMRNMDGINKYKKIIKDNRLNALVVDMKDDYGLLRFEPKTPLLKQKGKVTQYKIDIDTFVSEFKKDNTYLIGRIVVFKDRNLANWDKKQYAVWDPSTQAPWIGIKGYEDEKDEEGNVTGKKTLYYDENWVDPYSQEVWEYNIAIAKELIDRGFDEIQFDYIRFPTDGLNLSKAQFRWRDPDMNKESALVSFLNYARHNIEAPIGIDIYGANGWYRSGTRTGQDVEMMSEYVDVICPMFYPSHFEQNFMDYEPSAERPYRIYFYGSYRNTVIGRNRIVVRPWIQAFYMGVRYDKKWYNKDYVRREVFGTRDGVDHGYMYWNNSGKFYEDISPDPLYSEKSPWIKDEADLQKRLPAFGLKKDFIPLGENGPETARQEAHRKQMISLLNNMLEMERSNESVTSLNLLQVGGGI